MYYVDCQMTECDLMSCIRYYQIKFYVWYCVSSKYTQNIKIICDLISSYTALFKKYKCFQPLLNQSSRVFFLSLNHQNVNFVLYFLILWMGAEWASLKHCKESCSWDISDTTRIENSSWDFQFIFAKRREWDKHLILRPIQKIAYGERIIFCWAKAQDKKSGNLNFNLSDSNIVSKVNLLTLITIEDLRLA